MSATVDNRIVELEFENKQFEKGVSESLNTLDKLKNSLKLDDAAQNLSALSDASKKVDFSTISDSIDRLTERFSTLRMVGLMALSHIVDGVMNMAKKIGSALMAPISQMKAGGWARAANLENAQFQMQGILGSAEKVAKAMDSVDKAVTGTAYSLDEAAKIAAQLTASGVQLGDTLTNSLKSIAGVAAQTNSSFGDIGNIFATVKGQGKLMTMQLRQLEARGLNAAATIAKHMGTTEAAVRDMVSKGKISFEEFSDAMSEAFGENAAKANETFDGALSNMKSALNRIGAEFAIPIRANMIPVLNSVRLMLNAIKGSMGNVFDLFSKLTLSISTKLVGTIDKVTNFIKNDFTGLKNLNNALFISFTSIIKIIKTISDAFKQVFNGSFGDHVNNMAVGIEKFARVLQPTEKSLAGFKTVLVTLFTIIKQVGTVISWVISHVGGPLFTVIVKVTGAIFTLIGKLGNLISIVVDVVRNFTNFDSIIDTLADHGIDLTDKADKLRVIFEKISRVAQTAGKFITSALKGIGIAVAAIVATPIYLLYTGFQKLISMDWSKFVSALTHAKDLIVEFLERVRQLPIVQNIINGITTAFFGLVGGIAYVVEAVRNGFTALANGEVTLDSIKEKILGIPDVLKELGRKIASYFSGGTLFGRMQSTLDGVRLTVTGWVNNLKEALSELTPAKVLLVSFSIAMMVLAVNANKLITSITGLIDTASGGISTLVGYFSKEKTKLDKFKEAVITMVLAIGALVGAFILLSKVENLKQVAIILGSFIAVMAIITILTKIVNSKLMDSSSKTKFSTFAMNMLIFSAGVATLSAGLFLLGQVPIEGIWTKFVVISLIIAEMLAVSFILTKFKTTGLSGALAMVGFAIAILAIGKALQGLNGVDLSGVKDSWKEISVILIGVALIARALASVGTAIFVGAIAFLLAIKMFGSKLEKVGEDVAENGVRVISSVKKFKLAIQLFFHNFQLIMETIRDEWAKLTNEVKVGLIAGAVVVIAAIIGVVALIGHGVIEIAKNGKYVKRAAVSFVIVAAAIAGLIYLSKLMSDWIAESPNMLIALGCIGGMILIVGAFMALSRLGDPAVLKSASKIFGTLSILVLSMTAFAAVMGDMDEEQWNRANRSLTEALRTIGVFILLITIIGSIGKAAKAGFGTFAGITLLFGAVMGSLAMLMMTLKDDEDYIRMWKSVSIISALLIALGIMFALVGKIRVGTAWKPIAALAGAAIVIGGAIAAIAKYLMPEQDYIAKVATIAIVMIAVLGALIILAGVITHFAKNSKFSVTEKSEKTLRLTFDNIGKLVLALIGVALALALLKDVDPGQMVKTALIVVGVILALSVITVALQALAKKWKLKGNIDILLTLGSLVVMFIALAATFAVLDDLSSKAHRLLAVSQVIVLVIFELAAITVILSKMAEDGIKALAALPVLLGLTAIFAALAFVVSVAEQISGSADRMIATSQVIMLVLGELVGITAILGVLGIKGLASLLALPTLVGLTAIFTTLAVVIAVVEKIGGKADRMLAVSQVVALVLLELVVIEIILGVVFVEGLAAILAIPALAALAVIFTVLAVVIAAVEKIGGKADRMLAVSQVVVLVLFELVLILAVLGIIGPLGLLAVLAVPALAALTVIFTVLGLVIAVVEKIGGKADRMLAVSQVIVLVLFELVLILTVFGIIAPLGALATVALPALTILVALFTILGLVLAVLNHLNLEGAEQKAAMVMSLLLQLVAITALFAALSIGTVGMLAGVAAIMVLVVAIGALVAVLKILEPISFDAIAKGLEAIGLALGMVLTAGATAALVSQGLFSLGAAIVALGVGCLAAGAGVLIFANGIAKLASTTPSQLQMLIATVKGFFTAIGQGIANGLQAIIIVVVNGIKQIKTAALTEAKGFVPDLIKALFATGGAEKAAKASGMSVGNAWVLGFRNSNLGWHSPPNAIEEFKKAAEESLKNNGNLLDAAKAGATGVGNAYTTYLKSTLGGTDITNIGAGWMNQLTNGFKSGEGGLLSEMNYILGIFGKMSTLEQQISRGYNTTLSNYKYQLESDLKQAQNEMAKWDNYDRRYWTEGYAAEKYLAAKQEADRLNQSLNDLENGFQNAGDEAEEFSLDLDGVGGAAGGAKDKMEDFRSSLESTLQSQMNIFQKFEEKAAMSKEELLANMQSQITGMTNWATNMDKLATLGIDKGLYQKLAEMGPEGAEYVGAFVNMTGDEMAKANELWAQSLVLPGNVANKITADWNGISTDMVAGLSAGWTDNEGNFREAALLTSRTLQEEYKADNKIASPSRVYWEMGYNIISGLRFGIWENRELAIGAMRRVSNLVKDAAGEVLNADTFYSTGASVVSGLARGISENSGAVDSAIATLKAKVQEAGRFIAEGLGKGEEEGTGELKKKSKNMAEEGAIEPVQETLKQHSPSKVFYQIGRYIDEGLANGIRDYTGIVRSNSENMAEEAIEAMRYTVATIAATIQDGVEDPVITPVLDLSKVSSGLRTLNNSFSTSQALGVAGSLSNLQNRQSNGDINFIQNNYSPKALSRTDIYRQTNNQLTMLRRVAVN